MRATSIIWVRGLALALMLATVISAQTIVPSSFNYQGVLRDGTGAILPSGNTLIEFRLYTAATGGGAVWGRSYTVNLDTNGLFNVELNDNEGSELISGSTLPQMVATHPNLYIGLTVSGSAEIAPRQKMLSVPYAMMAGDVQEASADFTVKGNLTVDSNIQALQGAVAAKNMELSENGLTATLGVNSAGNLTAQNIDLGGSLTADGDLTTRSIKVNHGDNYDVWVQGSTGGEGGGNSRNLALLGDTQDDRLHVNWGSEYAGGTEIGGPVNITGGLEVHGSTSAFGGFHEVANLDKDGEGSQYEITVSSDGFFYVYSDAVGYHVYINDFSWYLRTVNDDDHNISFNCYPVAKGDLFKVHYDDNFSGTSNLKVYWRPFGR